MLVGVLNLGAADQAGFTQETCTAWNHCTAWNNRATTNGQAVAGDL